MNFVKKKWNIINFKLVSAVFAIILAIGILGCASSVMASNYHAEGVVLSTDLLSGVSGEAWITGFTATSSVPASTTLGFLFSVDQESWYNQEGEEGVWDTMASGTASFDLRKLKWATTTLATTSLEFWYKVRLTTNIATHTPIVYDVEVEYSDVYDWTDPDYGWHEEGIILSTDLLSGVSDEAWITGFYATTSIPASTSVSFMFSVDGIDYYSALAEKNVWDAAATGTNFFDLRALDWSTSTLATTSLEFFYKVKLESNTGTATPIVYDVELVYAESGSYTPPDYGYYEEGIFTSNITSDRPAGALEYFGYNLSSLPINTNAQIMFSNDGTNYYSSTGTAWQWTELEQGDFIASSTGFDLTAMNWAGDLYYKLRLTSEGGTTTPVISEVKAYFEERAPVEFISIIDPDNGDGTDYTSLSLWEAAVQADLTATTTLVFSYDPDTASGTLPDGATITGATSGATGTLVHMTGTTSPATSQLMVKDISNGYFMKGEKVYVSASSSYFAYLTTSGDSAIATAKCRSTGGSPDTTAVTITGWTTSATNYIKIWTDPDDPYGRHLGKWDETKYRIKASGMVINIYEPHVRVYGLQIYANWGNGINLETNTNSLNNYVAYNIIREPASGSLNNSDGVSINDAGEKNGMVYVWNNIIYDFNDTDDQCIEINDYHMFVYAYNNTLDNCNLGLQGNGAARVYAKNNIAQNCNQDFSSGANFHLSSDYNLSSDWTAPGDNSLTTTTVQFLDATNNDFHLSPNDTAARDAGTSTILWDTNLSFSDDIDGTARGSAWDIGADEVPMEFVSTICEDADAGGDCGEYDYKSLGGTGNWEDKVECDLTASTTRVFGGSQTGTINSGNTVTFVYPDYATTTVTGTVVATTSDQILISNISGTSTPLAGVIGSSLFVSANNYWTIGTTTDVLSLDALGASPIAIAKIDGAWSASDTAAVTIGGWTTDNDNYIKIYTTDAARHQGKWDYNKYRNTGTFNSSTFNLREKYIRIQGLQIKVSADDSAVNPSGVTLMSLDEAGNSEVYVSSNIIQAQYSGIVQYSAALRLAGADAVIKFYALNNIVYDFYRAGDSTCSALALNGTDDTIYFYNNTIYNSYFGITNSVGAPGTIIAKNNLIASTSNPFDGAFAAGTDYNFTDIDDTPGVGNNNATSVTFSFVDADNNDFHLAPGDTGAKDKGMNLRNDTYLKIYDDIDGNVRANGFDIGADETAIKIYRSVGPSNTSALSTGSSTTLTIEDVKATFSAAQPDNIGVGDAIQYDSDGNGSIDSIAFIHKRVSSIEYLVSSASGTPPAEVAGDQDWQIYRAYTSLYDAEEGTENAGINSNVRYFEDWADGKDLVTANQVWMIACYADAVDTTGVDVSGWTTGAANYVKVFTPANSDEVGTRQRHGGKWDDSKYTITRLAGAYVFEISDEYVRVDGLQINHQITEKGIWTNGIYDLADIRISNNIVKGFSNSSDHFGIFLYQAGDNGSSVYVWNNIIYDETGAGGYAFNMDDFLRAVTVSLYNNTIYDCTTGINRISSVSTHTVIKNNIVQNTTVGYSGDFSMSSSNNISSDGTATGTESLSSTTVKFVDAANNDFHLAPDSPGIDQGTSTVSDIVTEDIDGKPIHTYDIGADDASQEFVTTVMESDGDFSSLSSWETANQVDLTATTTLVFDCSTTSGMWPFNSNVIGYTSGTRASSTVLATSTNQILLYNIGVNSSPSVFISGERVYLLGQASTSNYCDLANAGNSAIAVAQIDGAWNNPDTSAVEISGWETGEYNYIKIYTTDTARHKGKWDEGKYRIELEPAESSGGMIDIQESYIRIDGLQLYITGTFTWRYGIKSFYASDDVRISNNIIKNVAVADGRTGIRISNEYITNLKVFNNIIYGMQGTTGNSGINCVTSQANTSLYNNTAYDCDRCFTTGYRDAIAINNLAQNCDDPYNPSPSSWHSSSDYNISSKDSDAPNATFSTAAKTVQFLDEANDDFHLALSDTVARNAGVDLSNDATSSFATDIDGTPRGGAWDIGADEAATEFVSTICENTSAGGDCVNKDYSSLASWESTIESNLAASGTAVYSGAQTGTISADDAVTLYRAGTSQNIIGIVVATTSDQILLRNVETRHASSLQNGSITAQSGDQWRVDASNYFTVSGTGDQLGAPVIAVAKIDGAWSASDTSDVVIEGWETGPGNYIKVYTTETARHDGKWSYDKYRLIDNGTVIQISEEYAIIDGIQFDISYSGSGAWRRGILITSTKPEVTISNNIIRNSNPNANNYGIYSVNPAGSIFKVYNNIVYGFSGADNVGIYFGNSPTKYIYNNTVFDSTTGIKVSANYAYIKNNIVQNCSPDFSNSAGTWTNSDYNISSDATAPGSNSKSSTTVSFVSTSTEDFHLSPTDTAARNAGVNLSYDPNLAFNTDIDGEERPLPKAGSWDIGADEVKTNAVSMGGSQEDNDSLTDGLVGHWNFNEGFGSTVVDRSGNGNDGTWNGSGSHWTPGGRYGNGGEFNGSDDDILISSANDNLKADNSNGYDLTISAWIKPDILGVSDGQVIFGNNFNGTGAGEYGYSFVVDVNNGRKIDLYIGTSGTRIQNNTNLQIDIWQHVVVVYNNSTQSGIFYLNGQNDGLKYYGRTIGDGGNTFYIGADGRDGSGYEFDGNIDELRVYNRALSQREVALLYNEGKAAVEWNFKNNYKDTGTLCAVSPSLCKNLTAGGTGNLFTQGYLDEGITALSLDGSGYANIADDGYFDIASTADFSLVATMKYSGAEDDAVISKKTDSATTSAGWMLGLDYGYGDGIPVFKISDGTSQYNIYANQSVNDNKWHTIGVVFDEDSATGNKIYIDGVDSTAGQVGTLSQIYNPANSIALNIGRLNDNSGLFTGQIDRVAFYPYALTPKDVKRETAGGFAARLGHDPSKTTSGQDYDPFGGAPPVAWWKLDEMSGNTAYDYASSSLNGTWYGSGTSTWHTNGKIGMGGKFNGINDYIQYSTISLTNEFTLSAWVYPKDIESNERLVFGRINSANLDLVSLGSGASNDQVSIKISSSKSLITTDPDFINNKWQYLTVTRDSLNNVMVYRDGINIGNVTKGGIMTLQGLGNDPGTESASNFYGSIDDVKIYNYARTQAQIAWDYNKGKPVGHWKFDEASSGDADGATLIDSSGNGNYGIGSSTGSGLDYVAGKFGNALDFDGDDDFVDLGNTAILKQDIISIAVWAKWTGGTNEYVYSMGENWSDGAGLHLRKNSDSKINGFMYYDSGNKQASVVTNYTVDNNRWYHIVSTYDSLFNFKMYVNGEYIGSATGTQEVYYDNRQAQIGASRNSLGNLSNFFTGQIDDVRIYNYALPESMIKEIYNNGNVRFGE